MSVIREQASELVGWNPSNMLMMRDFMSQNGRPAQTRGIPLFRYLCPETRPRALPARLRRRGGLGTACPAAIFLLKPGLWRWKGGNRLSTKRRDPRTLLPDADSEPNRGDSRQRKFLQRSARARLSQRLQCSCAAPIPAYSEEVHANAQGHAAGDPPKCAVSPGRRPDLRACRSHLHSCAQTPWRFLSRHELPLLEPSRGRTTSLLPPGFPSEPQDRAGNRLPRIRCNIPLIPGREPCPEEAFHSRGNRQFVPARCSHNAGCDGDPRLR